MASGWTMALTRDAVRKPSVDHRRGFVDTAAHLPDDLVDDPPELKFIEESNVVE